MSARLTSELLVTASLRRAGQLGIAAVVLRRGDPDAGSLFVEIEKSASEAALLGRVTSFDEGYEGGYEWVRLTGAGWVAPAEVSERLAREQARDPDCWVISVQDTGGRNIFDLD